MGANLNQQETFLGTLEQAHFCFIQCYSRFWIFPFFLLWRRIESKMIMK